MNKKLTKKLKTTMLALLLTTSIAVQTGPKVEAIHVGYGVDWSWGTTPWSVWSATTNYRRGVKEVYASVYANGQMFSSGWEDIEATIDVGWTFGGRKAFFNYRR